jgi:hypothetical protein
MHYGYTPRDVECDFKKYAFIYWILLHNTARRFKL